MILCTGATGYVGSKLVPLLAQSVPVRTLDTETFGNAISKTPNVEFLQGDIRDLATLRQAVKGIDTVIHLAAIVTDELVDMNEEYSYDVNIKALQRLCQEAFLAGVKRFIYASSSSVYGAQDVVCDESTEPKPQTAYARQKLGGEGILTQYADRMWCFSVRSATCCGPAPRMRLDTIVNTFCAQAYFKKRITVWGGGQYRSNIHVADVAALYKALALTLDPAVPSGSFANAVKDYHTALTLAHMVADLIPCEVVVDKEKVDTRSYRMTTSRGQLLWNAFGWMPHQSIQQAIRSNRTWFQAGNIKDVDDSIFYNTRRMSGIMARG